MSKSTFENVRIAGCAVSLGEVERHIDDEPEYYNNDPAFLARLKNSIGFATRRVVKTGTTTADLCLHASLRLLDRLGVSSDDLGAIISVTQTPDYPMPGNAHLLHAALGASEDTCAIDVEMGCSGYIYGLWLAFMMASSGVSKVLLVSGDTLSRLANPHDRTTAPLFGDAGSATLIEQAPASASYFLLRSDGTGYSKMLVEAGGARFPSSEKTRENHQYEDGSIRSQNDLYMDGFGIFEFTMSKQPGLLRDILSYAGKRAEDIDYFVLHQANQYIVKTISKGVGLPAEKTPSDGFSLFGNQNSASIPGVLCGLLAESLQAQQAQVVLHGYGIGLSWGACQLDLDHVICLPPEVYAGNGEKKIPQAEAATEH